MLMLNRNHTIPLVMHGIVPDGKRVHFEDVELSLFREIINYCGDNFIDINDVGDVVKNTSPSLLMTFDDGLASDSTIALPLLIEKKIPSINFVISNNINKKGYLTKLQLSEMCRSGRTIGSHSYSHPDFTQLTEAEQLIELKVSKLMIEDFTGMEVRDFSFPFGRFNNRAIELANIAGYKRIFTSRHGIISESSSVIPRNSINGSMAWSSVRRSLNASVSTRLAWAAEDCVKAIIINSLGRSGYFEIRKLIVGK
jgi:peptidoglycan/xylan/chitin deacetylase (PgdA/CDA1 family)